MRILLTGASGYVGSFLLKQLISDGGHEVLCWGRSEPCLTEETSSVSCLTLDLDSPEDDLKKVQDFEPEVICHLAALSQPNRCEIDPETAQKVNVEFTRLICRVAKHCRAFLCYVSSEWVFDNLMPPKGGFTEEDLPHPITVYGQTKLKAEKLIRELTDCFAIVRPALIYGPSWEKKKTFFDWIEEQVKQGENIALFDDEWRTPVFIGDVVSGLVEILNRKEEGVFHFAGPEKVSRIEFGQRYLDSLGFSTDLIEGVHRADVEGMSFRAKDLALNSRQTERCLGMIFRSLADGFQATSESGG